MSHRGCALLFVVLAPLPIANADELHCACHAAYTFVWKMQALKYVAFPLIVHGCVTRLMAKVILESEDKEQFEVLREVAVKSTVIRQMIETNPDNDEPIPLVDRRYVVADFTSDIVCDFWIRFFCVRIFILLAAAANPTFSKKCSTT